MYKEKIAFRKLNAIFSFDFPSHFSLSPSHISIDFLLLLIIMKLILKVFFIGGKSMNSSTIKRIIMTFVGIFLTSISVSIFKASLFGTDPFSCFAIGIWNVSHIKYSVTYIILNAVLLLGVFVLDKHYIGLGTLLNLFFAGYIVEKGMQLFDLYLPQRTLPVRILLLAIAVVLVCFASALYFTADMGVSTYDACALMITKKTKLPFRVCRIGTDLIVTTLGFFMGATVGIGTLVTAFGMGPLIEFFNRTCARPILYHKTSEISLLKRSAMH